MQTKSSTPNAIEINPTSPPIGTVIWLHGLGADGNDFVSMVPELNLPENLPLRFIFPHAPLRPVTINNGYVMRAWFDIYSLKLDQRIDQEGIAASVKLVEQLILREKECGIPSNKIILAGFSQGSVIALCTGLRYPQPLAGILALSGFLPQAEEIIRDATEVNQSIPIFMAHGTEDAVIPYALCEQTAAILAKYNYPVTFKSYAMPHSVCAKEIQDIAVWLKGVFS